MKKLFGIAPLALLFVTASASAQEAEASSHTVPVHSETGFYTAVKGIVTLGRTKEEETSTLDGNTGKGIGLELGYKIGMGFSIESDATYVRNTVTEKKAGEEDKTASGTYTSVSLDLVYVYHLTHHLAAFAKGGYEYETEKIDDLGINGDTTGAIYAAGAEYAVSDHAALMVEYEGTTIDGPLGDMVFAGMLYHF